MIRPLVTCVVLQLARGGGAAEVGDMQGMAQDAMAESGIAMVKGFDLFDFGSSGLKEAKGRNLEMTSRVNQNFLRRGTRADLERIAIERLVGRRGPDDWLLAGSDAWLERREKVNREAAELRERVAIADACARNPQIEMWSEDYGCVMFCRLAYPCAGCNDGLYNGDETGVDCGGSCVPCPTCDDGIRNAQETGTDCGGPDCEECEVFDIPGSGPTGEPAAGDVCNPGVDPGCTDADPDVPEGYIPAGCSAADPRDCIIRNRWTAQSGAHIENMPWYQPTAEFYPWLPGSLVYNSSHWSEYDTGTYPINIPGQAEPFVPADHGITTGAHTMYGR